jgi:polyhydroxybutyrate depolymerase
VIVPRAGTAPRPLLVVLHGYGGGADAVLGRAEIERVAATAGVVVAFPEGTRDDRGNRFWNATRACCNFYADDVDDVAHLLAVVDEIVATTPIDPTRIGLYGHSNGHFMAYRLACTHAERFRIVVGLAGATDADPAACRPSRGVGVVHIHGTADQVIRFDGGRLAGPYPGALDSAKGWAARNGCDPGAPEPAPQRLDLTDDVDGEDTTQLQWSCPPGFPVELWRIDGADHSPSFTERFAAAVIGLVTGTGPVRR